MVAQRTEFRTVLRITPSQSANAAIKYFDEGLKRDDYYLKGEAVKANWLGSVGRVARGRRCRGRPNGLALRRVSGLPATGPRRRTN